LIQRLYNVERACTELSLDARRDLRRERSIPLLAKIKEERDQLAQTVLPKSPLGDALRYLTNQWAALQRLSRMGGSPSTTTAPRISSASSPWVARTGCLPVQGRAAAGRHASAAPYRTAHAQRLARNLPPVSPSASCGNRYQSSAASR
jgi:hypothetical protein